MQGWGVGASPNSQNSTDVHLIEASRNVGRPKLPKVSCRRWEDESSSNHIDEDADSSTHSPPPTHHLDVYGLRPPLQCRGFRLERLQVTHAACGDVCLALLHALLTCLIVVEKLRPQGKLKCGVQREPLRPRAASRRSVDDLFYKPNPLQCASPSESLCRSII